MWTLTKLTLTAKTPTTLSVDAVLTNDADGSTRLYSEPNVSDVTTEGLATIIRNQLRQLNLIASTQVGDVDVAAINALLEPPPDPTPDPAAAKMAAFAADIRKRAALLTLKPDDPEVAAIDAKLEAALGKSDERDLLLAVARL